MEPKNAKGRYVFENAVTIKLAIPQEKSKQTVNGRIVRV